MKKIILLSLLVPLVFLGQNNPYSDKFAHTYSIVAKDVKTGEMAVGVQSHWFSVGTLVSWGKSGVGVVATQSFVNPSYGPKGLELMESGLTAKLMGTVPAVVFGGIMTLLSVGFTNFKFPDFKKLDLSDDL